ncbi:MAG: MBL fold metallo-hydrolase [Spirochaetes bacterium]|nr:MBL fold metallo-hydrolase [Deltaproteobacteria bacterium]RKY01875.1 MAG: MBL fold metallo-hydrolase [Spirochaetota bacterium]RLA90316.1 MAG: MBL fold metallo-hydrolase [Deltaproteobacteria bacterium]
MKLLSSLYYYPWRSYSENNCNSYFLDIGVKTLIDVGHRRFLPLLLNSLKEDGIDPSFTKLIFATHMHPDHFEGVDYFFNLGAMVTMHKEEERHTKEYGMMLYEMMELPFPYYSVEFYLDEGDLFLLGERFKVFHTPGHSPGSLSLYWEKNKVLFTGDLIFYHGVGRTDFYEGDGNLLKKSIEKLMELDVEYLLPGHGDIIVGKTNVKENFFFIRSQFFPYL